jgi:nitroreductase
MSVLQAVTSRRSAHYLGDSAPDDDELLSLTAAAATAPDHGRLRAWRLIVLRGGVRELLGEAMAATAEGPIGRQAARGRALRAPVLVSIVLCPRPHPVVREWEQLASVAAMVQNLSLLLHDRGWGSIWRTGKAAECSEVRQMLRIRPGEQLLGWLYIGSPEPAAVPAPRPDVDIRSRVSFLHRETLAT